MRSLRIKILVGALVAAVIVTLLVAIPTRASDGSTSLSIEPEIVRVPHLDLEQGLGRFYIDVHLNNVQDLTWFKFTLIFDGDVLGTLPDGWYGDPSEWSHGGTASGSSSYGSYVISSYETGPLSGSGVLLAFWFYPRAAGTTKIEFREVELRNSNGDVIPCTFIGNEVEVLPFDTWLNGEYERLSTQYDELQTQYTDLEAKHGTLSGEYSSLESSYTTLESSYSSLEEDHASLSTEHTVLESDYSSLESDYDELKLGHQSTIEQLEATKSQLSTTQILLYVFIGATAVLLCVMVFLLLRRRGATP